MMTRTAFVLITILLAGAAALAQQPVKAIADTAVSHLPEFPGGMTGLQKYLSANLQWPGSTGDAAEALPGKILVDFVIDTTGKATDINMIRPVPEAVALQITRLIRDMPRWTPGTINGTIAAMHFILPVFICPGDD